MSVTTVNVDVLRTHPIDELHIPEEQVKVTTGTQRGLDGLNLAARDCTVRYIVDGRLFVVEYKGEHLREVPKEIEKEQVVKLRAEHSEDRCRFAFIFKPEAGLNPTQQLDAALK